MGSTTLGSMINSVFARIDENPASDNAVNQGSRPEIIRVRESLNAGYRKVFVRLYGNLRPQVLDALQLNTGIISYSLSPLTDVLKTLYVYSIDTPGTLIPESNVAELTKVYSQLTDLGNPMYWYRYKQTISFYPVPATQQTVVVEGSVAFKELTNATDTTYLPDEHDFLLQCYANGIEKAFWKDPEAKLWLDEFEDRLDELHSEALRNAPTKIFSVNPYSLQTEDTCPPLVRHYPQ